MKLFAQPQFAVTTTKIESILHRGSYVDFHVYGCNGAHTQSVPNVHPGMRYSMCKSDAAQNVEIRVLFEDDCFLPVSDLWHPSYGSFRRLRLSRLHLQAVWRVTYSSIFQESS